MGDSLPAMVVDMGGSKFIVGYVDNNGKVLCEKRYTWTELTPDGVMKDVITALRTLQREYPQYKAEVLGLTIPGLADPVQGMWVEASFSGIRNLPVASILGREFGLPVYIDNDTRACALAEQLWGCCRGVDNFVWITVSNGIGGAVFANGSLYFGALGNAGEVGHVVVEEGVNARPCQCGHSGCAEMHASGRGLAKNYIALGGHWEIGGEQVNAKSIDALARQGDPVALQAYHMEGVYLGRLIGMCANVLNPRKVVIGGGVSQGFDLFEKSLLETLQTHMYTGANRDLKVESTALGYTAALVGAAALGFSGLLKSKK